MSLERIALAAIKIADAEGLAAVSMQRVASEFDFTTMALYRYLPGKLELIDLMLEVGLGESPGLASTPGGWRGKLTEWTARISALVHRHPWSLEVLNRLRIMGPNELGWLEAALGALAGTGLTGEESLDAVFALMGHVRASAQYTVEAPVEQRGLGAEAWAFAMRDAVSKNREAYPTLAAIAASGAFEAPEGNGLAFGLARIMDGLELLIARRRGSGL